jgi:hypothetical protein
MVEGHSTRNLVQRWPRMNFDPELDAYRTECLLLRLSVWSKILTWPRMKGNEMYISLAKEEAAKSKETYHTAVKS